MDYHFTANSRLVSDIFTKYKNTFLAFCELINNSIQADATEIKITLEQNPIKILQHTILNELKIYDNGVGVSKTDFEKKITEICTDSKPNGQGIGRFAAFQLGALVEIETVAYDQEAKKFTKTTSPINFDDFKENALELTKIHANHEILEGEHKSYYQVTIKNFYDEQSTKHDSHKRIHKNLFVENICDALFLRYPLEIFNGKISIFVNEKKIDPSNYIVGKPEKKTKEYIDLKGNTHSIDLTFLNYKAAAHSIKVFFRIENSQIKTNIYEFDHDCDLPDETNSWLIYIDSELFKAETDIFRNFVIADISEESSHLINATKMFIDGFFKEKYKEYFDFTANLKGDPHYPYKEKQPSSNSKKIVFNQIAYYIESEHKILRNKNGLRKIIYPLIDKAINHGDLEFILSQIIPLNNEKTTKFKELLKKADLEHIIQFSENVATKVQFLDFLNELVYGKPAKHVKERSELHKIIEKELWVFGEQYDNTPNLFSDKSLKNNLNSLREKLFTDELSAEEGTLIELEDEELKDITDLFFYNERILDDEKREVMIVELKAPKCRIGQKELGQLDRYRFDIEQKGHFSKEISFKIILISSDLTAFAKSTVGTEDTKNPYLYKRSKNAQIETWVIKWSDLIHSNKKKLSYLGNWLQTKDRNVQEVLETEYKELELDRLISIMAPNN